MKFPPLDPSSAVPLYSQIEEFLLQQIRSGAFKPGQCLPSEEAIAEHFRVSRMTGRQALKSLRDQGIAYSVRGKGTFVSGIKLVKDSRRVDSFTEEMRSRDLHSGSQVLTSEIIGADDEAANSLRISPGEKVISLRRIRLADSSPLSIEWSRIPHRLCPDLLDVFKPSGSLYETLARHYGIRMAIADEVAEAGLASARDARLLGIVKGNPVFLFTRISYVQSGDPAEFVKSIYRADRYKIVSRLTRLNR